MGRGGGGRKGRWNRSRGIGWTRRCDDDGGWLRRSHNICRAINRRNSVPNVDIAVPASCHCDDSGEVGRRPFLNSRPASDRLPPGCTFFRCRTRGIYLTRSHWPRPLDCIRFDPPDDTGSTSTLAVSDRSDPFGLAACCCIGPVLAHESWNHLIAPDTWRPFAFLAYCRRAEVRAIIRYRMRSGAFIDVDRVFCTDSLERRGSRERGCGRTIRGLRPLLLGRGRLRRGHSYSRFLRSGSRVRACCLSRCGWSRAVFRIGFDDAPPDGPQV